MHHLNGAAVRISYKALMIFHCICIYFRNYERHARIHSEIVSVINNENAAINRFPSKYLAGTLGAFGSCKERYIYTIKCIGSGFLNIILHSVYGLFARRSSKDCEICNRELALIEHLYHFFAYGACTRVDVPR